MSRTTKKEIIHCAFKVAQALNRKLYMSEKDYKKFYKSCLCEYGDGSTFNGAVYTKDLVIHNYREALKIKALFIDNNSAYGGYRLDQFYNEHGATDHLFTSSRSNASVFVQILRAFIAGFYQGGGF